MSGIRIDSHVHITPPHIIKYCKKYAEKDDHFKLLAQSPVNSFATAEDVITELDNSNWDKAVIFGFSFKDQGLCREVNEYTIEAVKKYPERFIGFASLNPTSKDATKELEKCISSGLQGVGELLPDGQGFDISNQDELGHLTYLLSQENIPVLIHVNEPVGHYYPGKTATSIKKAAAFVENNPNLKIIFAHWGGGLFFYELMPELYKKFKNVYYDTAASPFLYNHAIYDAAYSSGVIHKIVFGSDFPLLPISRYSNELEKTNLNDKEKNMILGENINTILS